MALQHHFAVQSLRFTIKYKKPRENTLHTVSTAGIRAKKKIFVFFLFNSHARTQDSVQFGTQPLDQPVTPALIFMSHLENFSISAKRKGKQRLGRDDWQKWDIVHLSYIFPFYSLDVNNLQDRIIRVRNVTSQLYCFAEMYKHLQLFSICC